MKQWIIMIDGPEHKTARASFPSEFMVYKVSKHKHFEYM